jgi:O-antigen ligase
VTALAPHIEATATDVARYSFIALGLSIPISVALDGVLCALILLAWLLAGQIRATAQLARTNPVTLFALLWFAAHGLAAIYSIGEPNEIQRTVTKAAMFLLVPIGVTIMARPCDRERALYAFMAAVALTAVLSCLRWAGVIPGDAPLLKPTGFSAAVVFKFHLTQNLLLAFGAFVLAVYAERASNRRWRIALIILAALAALNVFVIGDGRTGQAALLLLMLYYGGWRLGRRGLLLALAIGLIIGAAAYGLPDTAIHKRAAVAISEAEQWEAGAPVPKSSSVGNRLEFYKHSLNIVARHALMGVGSGGFATAYSAEALASGAAPTTNPHNEYLLRAVELGIPGLLLMLAMFWVIWHTAGRLSDSGHAAIARALVITFAVASLASSTLNDHTESLLFIWMLGVLFAGIRRSGTDARAAHTLEPLEQVR